MHKAVLDATELAPYQGSNDVFHTVVTKRANPAVITLLLRGGADPKAQNKSGWMPLHYAEYLSTNPAVAAALLDARADPAAKNE